MNLRATVRTTSRWVLLLYLAVLAVTGTAHSCPSSGAAGCESHATIAAGLAMSGSQDCPTCDLHRATVSALVTSGTVTVLLPRDACSIGESAISLPNARPADQLSRGPPSA